ncbi:alpha/beta fold hydrolase [Thioflexithrix psekupsensis]|nr:alpha/beta fold hydrolase [Thioflexithrix psekupsensis]
MLRLFFLSLLIIFIWGATVIYRELPQNVVLANGTHLAWQDCTFFDVDLSWEVKTGQWVFCGFLTPANQPAGLSEPLRLPVVWLKRPFWYWGGEFSPMLYLAGGPGGAAYLELGEYWRKWQGNYLDARHDLILFDQRGSGLSQPKISCTEWESSLLAHLDKLSDPAQEAQQIQQIFAECYQHFLAQGIDLSGFNTKESTQDVADLMAAIGGDQWNLYGSSYGTRLALSVVRAHSDKLRSVVFDSVYPPEKNAILALPWLWERLLDNLLSECEIQHHCREAFPDLRVAFAEALARLQFEPFSLLLPLQLQDSEELELMPVMLDAHRFLHVLFYAFYSRDLIVELPAMIEGARQGRSDALMLPASLFFSSLLDGSLNYAVYLSVDCADTDRAIADADVMARQGHFAQEFPVLKQFLDVQWQYHWCHVWPVRDVGAEWRQVVKSEVPGLFLAGQLDPVTPSVWAREAASHFTRGYFFEFAHASHAVLDTEPCAAELLKSFLRDPHQSPDAACVNEARALEFTVLE